MRPRFTRLSCSQLLCSLLLFTFLFVRTDNRTITSAKEQPGADAAFTRYYHVLSIPAASFRNLNAGILYRNDGRCLALTYADGGMGKLFAPLNLPRGANISKVTLYFRDNHATADVNLSLYRTPMDNTGAVAMAGLNSSGALAAPAYGSTSTTDISDPKIDNSAYAYSLELLLPEWVEGSNTSAAWGCGVTVEYYTSIGLTSIHDYYSMSAAAFTPYEGGYDSWSDGAALQYSADPQSGTNNGWFSAPVYLPQGATVTKVQLNYYLESNYAAVARLQRADPTSGDYAELATVWTGIGSPGVSSAFDDSVTDGVIDNENYTYWVIVDIPARTKGNSNILIYGVLIYYDHPTSGETQDAISLPTTAFNPVQDSYGYQNHSRYLFHLNGPMGFLSNGSYLAPLNLPNGVYVTGVKCFWYDTNDSANATILVKRAPVGGDAQSPQTLATIDSSNSLPYAYFNKEAKLSAPVIDNRHYLYWLDIDLPPSTATSHLGAGDVATLGIVVNYVYHPIFIPAILSE